MRSVANLSWPASSTGSPATWLVDITEPSVVVLELSPAGEYEEPARLAGAHRQALDRPFPVTLAAADLVTV